MSIHKLTAGSGYDYLTRQVAALDATEKGHLTPNAAKPPVSGWALGWTVSTASTPVTW
jgi:hypothetical protein